ncbi:hypothetical protein [Zavarzinia sp.]|uniref:hypothetical protein n=1 Tax=Zavarzinia sp. TaxID=2027920 RepID=UPI003BB51692
MNYTPIRCGRMPDGTPIMGRMAATAPARKPDTRPPAERMADDMMTAYERKGAVLDADLSRAGWTVAEIAEHGDKAGSILRRRIGRQALPAEA